MTTYSEAIRYARKGGTISRGGKTIRLLTQEEANAYALKHNPSRRVAHDENGVPIVKDGNLVIEEFGEGKPKRLGLFDVSQSEDGHALSYRPTDDDIYGPVEYEPIELEDDGVTEKPRKEKPRVLCNDWELVGEAKTEADPEPISPDDVEKALMETEPPAAPDHL